MEGNGVTEVSSPERTNV